MRLWILEFIKTLYTKKNERIFLNGQSNIHELLSALTRVQVKTRVSDNFRAFNFDLRRWKIHIGFSRRSELLREESC